MKFECWLECEWCNRWIFFKFGNGIIVMFKKILSVRDLIDEMAVGPGEQMGEVDRGVDEEDLPMLIIEWNALRDSVIFPLMHMF